MANYTTPYDPVFYAQEALMVLENALGMAARVHRGYDQERKSANVGSTIQIRKPGTFSTQAGGTGTAADIAPNYITISVDDWREVKFALTDKELAYTGEKIIQEHISPAVYALANYIEDKITDLYAYVPWSYNLAATQTEADIVGARKILRDNAGSLMDTDTVHFAIDSTLEAAFLNRAVFHAASTAGEADSKMALMRGHLGTRFGVEHFVQQTLSSHTSGTVVSGSNDLAGALSATAAIRATSITVTGLTGTETILAGDSFVLAGNTQRYVATATTTLSSGAGTINLYPALVQAYNSGTVITFETIGASNYADSYYYNIMFHRNAFAFATAPLPMIGDGAGARMAVITDPRTGLSLRSRVAYVDSSATVNVTLDVLFGVKCLDPNLAVICRRNA
jgi:hypothetical protein